MRAAPDGPTSDGGRRILEELALRLEYSAPYATAPLLNALARHSVRGLEETDLAGRTHTRVIHAPGGPALIRVAFGEDARHVEARLRLSDPSDAGPVTAIIRRWLDLDADPLAIDQALAASDPLLRPLVRARPGLRVLGAVDGFEAAAMTVLGQQVSLAAGRTFGARLVAAFGRHHLDGFATFPSPDDLAGVAPEDLQATVGLTLARARTLQALAEAIAGGLSIDPGSDHGEVRQRLLSLPGIGPWTVDYLTLRALGDRDGCPAGDLVLKRALGVTTAREVTARSLAWRPWRAYAVTHLWTREMFG